MGELAWPHWALPAWGSLHSRTRCRAPERLAPEVVGHEQPHRAEERHHALAVGGGGRVGLARLHVTLHGRAPAVDLAVPEDGARLRVERVDPERVLGIVVHGSAVAVESGAERLVARAADRRGDEDAVAPDDGAAEGDPGHRGPEADVLARAHVPGEGRSLTVAVARSVGPAKRRPGPRGVAEGLGLDRTGRRLERLGIGGDHAEARDLSAPVEPGPLRRGRLGPRNPIECRRPSSRSGRRPRPRGRSRPVRVGSGPGRPPRRSRLLHPFRARDSDPRTRAGAQRSGQTGRAAARWARPRPGGRGSGPRD